MIDIPKICWKSIMKKNIHSQTIFMNKKIALVPYNSENKGVKVAKTINADVLESHDVLRL